MDAEKLLVHDGRQRKAVKGVHTRLVHRLTVLDLTWSGWREGGVEGVRGGGSEG